MKKQDILFLDTETYNETPIRHGAYKYLETVELMLFSWALNDAPVSVWDITTGEKIPPLLEDSLQDERSLKVAHEVPFDRGVIAHTLSIDIPIEQWHDTAVQARAHSLPGGLAKLCEVYGVPEEFAKHVSGKQLIHLFCKPRPKNCKERRATRHTHPKQWADFVRYAGSDVEAMRWLFKRMPRWNYPDNEFEHRLWMLDDTINRRGFAVDLPLAHGAVEAVARTRKLNAAKTTEATDGAVTACTQRDKLLQHILQEYGVSLPDLKADTLQRRADDESLPSAVRELIALRLEAARTGDSKYKALLRSVSKDDRLRGTTVFCGAARTGRWAGRLFQPHNMARIPKWVKAIYDAAADAVSAGVVDLLYADVIELVSKLVRACVVAPPGKRLDIADLRNIEGRILAWLAGESWKVKAFEDYDKGIGEDMYVLAYSRAFGVPVAEVKADAEAGGIMRDIGKVQELSGGYQGAVGAHRSMAANYGLDLGSDEDVLKNVRAHRKANPRTVKLWYYLEKQVKQAILHPGQIYKCRSLAIRRDAAWLRIKLPSGRYLCYPSPCVDGGGISYIGNDPYSRKWTRLYTYGGKLVENCLAGDTEIRTRSGWKRIDSYVTGEELWDGEAWVRGGNLLDLGVQTVICLRGVKLTPDHRVLAFHGWTTAGDMVNGKSAGFSRQKVLLPDDITSARELRRSFYVDGALYLWTACSYTWLRINKKKRSWASVLRMQEKRVNRQSKHHTWDVSTPGVLGVARDERPLQAENTSCLEKLRSARDTCLQTLARIFPEFLERHGRILLSRIDPRSQRQQRRLHSEKLQVGVAARSGKQQAHESAHRNSVGTSDSGSGFEKVGHKQDNNTLSLGPSVADRQTVYTPRLSKSHVYDITNVGPRNRFVVRASADQEPFIVHNCVQAIARDILGVGMLRAEGRGYKTVLHVHDELITEMPDSDGESTHKLLADIMAMGISWTKGLPLAAAGFSTKRYRKG